MSRLTLLTCLLAISSALIASPAHARSTLTVGDRGTDVRNVRAQLAHLGYLPARGDDRYDQAALHAVMAYQKVRGIGRDGVAGPQTRRALRRSARSHARPRPALRRGGRRIEVDLSQQVAKLIISGRVTRTIAISSGAPGFATPQGEYRIFRKETMSWSIPFKQWLPNASYFTGGIAFHAYPSVPGQPASHGCVRVPEPFSRELYEFARMRTSVVVLA